MVSTSTGSQRGFEGRLAIGHLVQPVTTTGSSSPVAHHDDEPDPAVDEGEAPTVGPVPAKLSVQIALLTVRVETYRPGCSNRSRK